MNKAIKRILLIINVIMLAFAILWFFDEKSMEPLIASFGQISSILLLIFEKQVSEIFTKNIKNSDVKIQNRDGDRVHMEDIADSEIHIS